MRVTGNQNIARKITRTLFFAHVSVSAGLISISTITSIAGMELSGKASWAGVPGVVFLLAAASGALGAFPGPVLDATVK